MRKYEGPDFDVLAFDLLSALVGVANDEEEAAELDHFRNRVAARLRQMCETDTERRALARELAAMGARMGEAE